MIDVALVRDFSLQLITDRLIASANNDVRLNATRAQLGDAVLSWFGLLLAAWPDERNKSDMHIANVVATNFVAKLTNRFQEREDLDVANSSTNFSDHHIHVFCCKALNTTFDFVSYMRNDLNSSTQIVATTFRCEHCLIDTACCCVG